MVTFAHAWGDGLALNRAYRWRGEQRFGDALAQLVDQHGRGGRPFPSERSPLPAVAMAASLNYQLEDWDEVVRYCNVAVAVARSRQLPDSGLYLLMYCDELARSCRDHSDREWEGPATPSEDILVANLKVPSRYHRYFPLLWT